MRLALALLLALALAVLPLPVAAAQERTPTPSAEELWEAYPLHPTPAPSAAPTAASRPPEPTPAPSGQSAPVVPLMLLGVAIALGLLVLPELRGRRVPAGHEAASSALPPDPHRRWIATIEWRHDDAQPRFCACARDARSELPAVLATSRPLQWPPAGPDSVQALAEAAEQLEEALLSAGWTPLPPGREWYAKRFAWKPVRAAASRRFVRRRPRVEAGRAP